MRTLVIALTLGVLATATRPEKPPRSTIPQLPDGTLSGDTYTNGALGLSWQFPAQWAADIDPKDTDSLDPKHPNGRARQCSRVLVWTHAPRPSEDRFASTAALIAIDPRCLTHAEFPQSALDSERTNDVIDALIKNFKNSMFFSPYGVKIVAFSTPGAHPSVTIDLTGGMTINAIGVPIGGRLAATKEPLKVNTCFNVIERHGYWLVMAYVADDSSTEELKHAKPTLTDPAP
jgi:hypothetical protein